MGVGRKFSFFESLGNGGWKKVLFLRKFREWGFEESSLSSKV
jgi:hypothetical protein